MSYKTAAKTRMSEKPSPNLGSGIAKTPPTCSSSKRAALFPIAMKPVVVVRSESTDRLQELTTTCISNFWYLVFPIVGI